MISVVCPFYNEELILEASVRLMLKNLETLSDDWELVVVNDGSKDRSPDIARGLEKENSRLRVVGYASNRGRGFALREGIAAARGDVVVTTEIDSSWGDDIVHRLVAEFKTKPDADIIIASPHLPGGGYKNVPPHRIVLSTVGNWIIRGGLSYTVTMNTGMTRAYRRDKFLALPLDENGKEQHLEIVSKALAFGYRIYEVPAVLEWKDHKLSAQPTQKRKSSSKINALIRTHFLFSLLAAPFRYLYPISFVAAAAGVGFFGWGVFNLATRRVSIYVFLCSILLEIFALLIFGIGVLAQQGRMLQREMWKLRSEYRTVGRGRAASGPESGSLRGGSPE